MVARDRADQARAAEEPQAATGLRGSRLLPREFLLDARPGVAQRNNAVEHGPAGGGVDTVVAEVPVALELVKVTGAARCNRSLYHGAFDHVE
jgi:hypothetical protein